MIVIMRGMNPMSLTVSLDSLKPVSCSRSFAKSLGYASPGNCLSQLTRYDHFSGRNLLQIKQLSDGRLFTRIPVTDRWNRTVGFTERFIREPGLLKIVLTPDTGMRADEPWARFRLDTTSGELSGKGEALNWKDASDWQAAIIEGQGDTVRQVIYSGSLPEQHTFYYSIADQRGRVITVEHEVRVIERRSSGAVLDNLLFPGDDKKGLVRLQTLSLLTGVPCTGSDTDVQADSAVISRMIGKLRARLLELQPGMTIIVTDAGQGLPCAACTGSSTEAVSLPGIRIQSKGDVSGVVSIIRREILPDFHLQGVHMSLIQDACDSLVIVPFQRPAQHD